MAPRKRQAALETSPKSSTSKKSNKNQKNNDKDDNREQDKVSKKISKESPQKISKKLKDEKVIVMEEKPKTKGSKKEVIVETKETEIKNNKEQKVIATKDSNNVKQKQNKKDIKMKSKKDTNVTKEKSSSKGKKRKAISDDEDEDKSDEETDLEEPVKLKAKRTEKSAVSAKKKIKKEVDIKEEAADYVSDDGKIPKISKKKIKKEIDIKEEVADDESDLKMQKITREMVKNSQKWVGAHVSIAGGLHKAIEEACSLESNAFGLFLRSMRRWESPPLAQKSIDDFEKTMKEKNFGCSTIINTLKDNSGENDKMPSYFDSIKNQILPHASYLINLGNPDKAKRDKSYTVFLDDLKRCDALSIALYNFHPGSTCGATTVENSIKLIADGINKAHKETKNVKIVIENMAGQGNIIGSKFEELAGIIKLVENKDRIGVCLDTCHLFAAGYDLRTPEAWNKTLNEFDKIVGMKYFSAMHLNDSKGPLGCNKDRHESIGKGHIGLDCFKFIMEDSRFCNMPLILETPDEKLYFKEIQLLHSFLKSSQIKKDEN